MEVLHVHQHVVSVESAKSLEDAESQAEEIVRDRGDALADGEWYEVMWSEPTLESGESGR